jgi:hypothetical protein
MQKYAINQQQSSTQTYLERFPSGPPLEDNMGALGGGRD